MVSVVSQFKHNELLSSYYIQTPKDDIMDNKTCIWKMDLATFETDRKKKALFEALEKFDYGKLKKHERETNNAFNFTYYPYCFGITQ